MWWYHHSRTVCTLWYLGGGSYKDIFFLVGVLKSSFSMYYGRQLRQLTNVQNYGLLGPTPRKGKSKDAV